MFARVTIKVVIRQVTQDTTQWSGGRHEHYQGFLPSLTQTNCSVIIPYSLPIYCHISPLFVSLLAPYPFSLALSLSLSGCLLRGQLQIIQINLPTRVSSKLSVNKSRNTMMMTMVVLLLIIDWQLVQFILPFLYFPGTGVESVYNPWRSCALEKLKLVDCSGRGDLVIWWWGKGANSGH